MDQYNPTLPEGTYVNYAGFWIRFIAAFIDGIILMVPNFIIAFTIDGSIFNTGWTVNILQLILGWLYHASLESGSGQATFGKRIMEIKVVSETGECISFLRATGRHFSKIISAIILLIGYIMAAFDDRKQALHDKIANTLVVSNGSF